MDECDQAGRSERLFLRQAIDQARSKTSAAESLTECEDCGEKIPEGRRRAVPGCTRCIECETEFERRHGS